MTLETIRNGQMIRCLRDMAGLKQIEAAQKLAVSQAELSKLELGLRSAPADVERHARVYGVAAPVGWHVRIAKVVADVVGLYGVTDDLIERYGAEAVRGLYCYAARTTSGYNWEE